MPSVSQTSWLDALMVGVGVRERVGGDGAAAQLAQDPLGGMSRARVDEHVTDQVDVDRVRRKPVEQVEVVGEPLHRRREPIE